MLSVRLPLNNRLLAVELLESQKLYTGIFTLCVCVCAVWWAAPLTPVLFKGQLYFFKGQLYFYPKLLLQETLYTFSSTSGFQFD